MLRHRKYGEIDLDRTIGEHRDAVKSVRLSKQPLTALIMANVRFKKAKLIFHKIEKVAGIKFCFVYYL